MNFRKCDISYTAVSSIKYREIFFSKDTTEVKTSDKTARGVAGC